MKLNPALKSLHNKLAELLDQAQRIAADMNVPMPNVTLLMRDPANDDASVVVSNDDHNEAIRLLTKHGKNGQAPLGTIVVHDLKGPR